MNSMRLAALKVSQLEGKDKKWLLNALDNAERARLKAALKELRILNRNKSLDFQEVLDSLKVDDVTGDVQYAAEYQMNDTGDITGKYDYETLRRSLDALPVVMVMRLAPYLGDTFIRYYINASSAERRSALLAFDDEYERKMPNENVKQLLVSLIEEQINTSQSLEKNI